MTTANRQRCVHCKTSYIYHPSFYGGDERNYPHNHHEYCPDCYQAVKVALEKIPVKWEEKFLPDNTFTREQIVNHQEERLKGPGIPACRISPCLYDMTGKTRHNIVIEGMDGEWYMAEWWSNVPDDGKIWDEKIKKETWVEL